MIFQLEKNHALIRACTALVIGTLFFINLWNPVSGSYIYIAEGTEKCFAESLPAGLTILVTYNNMDNSGITSTITFRDDEKKPVSQQLVTPDKPEGRVAHMATKNGEHWVCISSPASRWYATVQTKWTISIEVGDRELQTAGNAQKGDILSVQNSVADVGNRVKTLIAQEDYHRKQEEEFQRAIAALDDRIIGLSLLQMLVLAGVTVFTVWHMTRFLQYQKLY